MPKSIPSNSTIRDVAKTLKSPDHFAANVLHLMRKAEKDHGSMLVKVGITGMGILPNFRIETANGNWKLAYDGVAFKPFTEAGTHDANWSSVAMTTEEVQKLVEELRNIKSKKSK